MQIAKLGVSGVVQEVMVRGTTSSLERLKDLVERALQEGRALATFKVNKDTLVVIMHKDEEIE